MEFKKPQAIDENCFKPKPITFSGDDSYDQLVITLKKSMYEASSIIYTNIEYAFFEIVRDIPDKASLEVVKSAFENMLSKERIEEIINFVDSMRK